MVGAAIVGLVFGSFVTALSYRLPRGESIAHGRSRCPACGHTLCAADLVPVLSWTFNRGACRHCGAKVSWRYPAIELATMAFCTVSAMIAPDLHRFALLLLMTPVLMTLTIIDLEHKRLPNSLVAILTVLALGWRLLGDGNLLAGAITATIAVTVGLLLDLAARRFTGGPGLGMGDTKLFAVAGIALAPGPFLLFAFAAGMLGLLWGILWRVWRGSASFPFSPAILLGFWLALPLADVALQRIIAVLAP